MKTALGATLMIILSASGPALGSITTFSNYGLWIEAIGEAGPVTDIDFVGIPHLEVIDDQYADLGVTFGNSQYVVLAINAGVLSDGYGATATMFHIAFDQPQSWFGTDFFGGIVELYLDDTLLFEGYLNPDSNFSAVLSDQPFNRVVMFDPLDSVVGVDNIYFGAPFTVPAPGALAVLFGGITVSANSWSRQNHRRRRR